MAKRQFKLPKKIAGVKLPKRMRKSANRITRHFETPLGRELIAGTLVAAAGALVGSRYVRETAEEVGQQVRTRTAESSGAAADLTSSIGSLLGKEKKKDRNRKERKQGIGGSASTH